jgi:hypothetical protein
LSALQGSIWPSLRSAAAVLCPPLEVVDERPAALVVTLRDEAGREFRLRYRSERGLFLRTYFLVVEAEVDGEGPSEPGVLTLRRGRLRWKRPKPNEALAWTDALGSEDMRAALKRLPVYRLRLGWEPNRSRWRLRLETLAGGVTVTFFPPLATPNPLLPKEAEALRELLAALGRAAG